LSNRVQPLTGERRSLVAIAVHLAHGAGVPWKKLERIYDRERRQLWRLAQEGAALMSQNRPLMSHLARGHGAGRDRMFDALSSTLAVSDSMGGLFGGGSTPAPVAPAAAPTLSDAAVTNAARQEQITAARTRGRAATILTGGMGTTAPAPTQSKVLMGG
jgi:hypothetical protein